ncbi:hypothetical protein B0A50_01511 [Salinomyces thailandicus]|uniref:J domain-containing protein n=1 Tax=Salinomyces thailandicus TaxID=706561 RepID=A0A4U0UDJ1_9PEZI|nr:hypothetical protein B0A50_01511 [Salinomyces thailandica]
MRFTLQHHLPLTQQQQQQHDFFACLECNDRNTQAKPKPKPKLEPVLSHSPPRGKNMDATPRGNLPSPPLFFFLPFDFQDLFGGRHRDANTDAEIEVMKGGAYRSSSSSSSSSSSVACSSTADDLDRRRRAVVYDFTPKGVYTPFRPLCLYDDDGNGDADTAGMDVTTDTSAPAGGEEAATADRATADCAAPTTTTTTTAPASTPATATPFVNFYAILGLPVSASLEHIRLAYRHRLERLEEKERRAAMLRKSEDGVQERQGELGGRGGGSEPCVKPAFGAGKGREAVTGVQENGGVADEGRDEGRQEEEEEEDDDDDDSVFFRPYTQLHIHHLSHVRAANATLTHPLRKRLYDNHFRAQLEQYEAWRIATRVNGSAKQDAAWRLAGNWSEGVGRARRVEGCVRGVGMSWVRGVEGPWEAPEGSEVAGEVVREWVEGMEV